MSYGRLSEYFDGIGTKILSRVDADKLVKDRQKGSNQHEVGDSEGGALFKRALGEERRSQKTDNPYQTRYIWVRDEQESIDAVGLSSWYDTRENKPERAPEWRLYYQSNPVTNLMTEGDRLFFAKEKNGQLLFIIVPEESELQEQMLWLFGLQPQADLAAGVQDFSHDDPRADFLTRFILDLIGVELEDPESNSLDTIIERFGLVFPTTKVFSDLARQTLPEVSALDDPDVAIMAWLDHEEAMFRRLESKVVAERLSAGWLDQNRVADVDDFIKYSVSVHNRRKSRMGHSFENHLAAVFDAHTLKYQTQKKTEKGKKPDFLFPGLEEYFDTGFDVNRLTMLAAKSTCKDRWPQILPEAEKLDQKHLVTLEPSISESQTETMRQSNVQLIVPGHIQESYTERQRSWLWTLSDFVDLVKRRQIT